MEQKQIIALKWTLQTLKRLSRETFTFTAVRSLSRLCPIKIVLSVTKLKRTACTSRKDVVTSSKSSSVMPLNLITNRKRML